jgi:hypothetical protein
VDMGEINGIHFVLCHQVFKFSSFLFGLTPLLGSAGGTWDIT